MRLIRFAGAMMMIALLLAACAFAEESAFESLPWLTEKGVLAPAPYAPDPSGFSEDGLGYSDASIDIRIEQSYWNQDGTQVDAPWWNAATKTGSTTVMKITVRIKDITQVRATTAMPSIPKSKQTARVEHMAKQNNGILALSGDYFSYHSEGIIIRNGKQLRNAPRDYRDALVIDDTGAMHIIRAATKGEWEKFLATGVNVIHAYSFGPGLVIDGEMRTEFDWNMNNGPKVLAQRLIIGQNQPGEFIILCTEGPESTEPLSMGFDLWGAARLAKAVGLENAYNLDGGSSCTVVFNGEKINSPSNKKRREVGDCLYFATLVPNN